MRTVEQVVSDLKKAKEQAAQANTLVGVLNQELKDIYTAARQALGIESEPDM